MVVDVCNLMMIAFPTPGMGEISYREEDAQDSLIHPDDTASSRTKILQGREEM